MYGYKQWKYVFFVLSVLINSKTKRTKSKKLLLKKKKIEGTHR